MMTNLQIQLRAGRVHEVFGSGKYGFAAYNCANSQGLSGYGKSNQGLVIWVSERRQLGFLNPDGLAPFCDPGQFIFTIGTTHLDVLWIAEEALRSGIAPIVVVEVQKQIDLTAGRRLQLAAEAGKSLGLFLIPEGLGSNAAETRWHCSSVYLNNPDYLNNFEILKSTEGSLDKDSTLFNWSCIKNKSGTINRWTVFWNGTTHHMHMVEQVCQPKSA